MDAKQYYAHARALGAFSAADCLTLAREAAELDRIAAAKKSAPPATIARETMPDGSAPINLSFGIKVY